MGQWEWPSAQLLQMKWPLEQVLPPNWSFFFPHLSHTRSDMPSSTTRSPTQAGGDSGSPVVYQVRNHLVGSRRRQGKGANRRQVGFVAHEVDVSFDWGESGDGVRRDKPACCRG